VFAASASATRRARVIDAGARYVIEIDGARRQIDDARRDCMERARVSAVFIALNLRASEPTKTAGAPGTHHGGRAAAASGEPAPRERAESEPERRDDDAQDDDADDVDEAVDGRTRPDRPVLPRGFGLSLFGLAERSTDAAQTAWGAGAGAFIGLWPFRFELSAGVLSSVTLQLQPRDDIRGRVQLTRAPLSLTTSYLLRVGAFQLGPTLGLSLDLLHIQGERVERRQSEWRLGLGALLAGDAHLWISSHAGLLLRLQMRFFPRAYRLAVDSVGSLGETPSVWLSAQLGGQWRF